MGNLNHKHVVCLYFRFNGDGRWHLDAVYAGTQMRNLFAREKFNLMAKPDLPPHATLGKLLKFLAQKGLGGGSVNQRISRTRHVATVTAEPIVPRFVKFG